MTKINGDNNNFYWLYKIGFLIILALPILTVPPYFAPPDWGKTIVFRSIMAIILFLFVWSRLLSNRGSSIKSGQILYRKSEIFLPVIKKNKIIWALSALFIVFLLATIFSVDPNFSLWGSPYRGGGFVDFAFYFVFAILAFILFRKEDWKNAWIFSIFIGILVSLIGIIQYYGLFNRIFLAVPDRPPSTMGNPDLLAMYLLFLCFIALCYTIREIVPWKKIFYAFSSILFLYVILITGSRAVYLGILIGGIYFLLFYPKKIKYIKIAIVGLIILMAGIILYVNTVNQYPKFLQQNRLFESTSKRFLIGPFLKDSRFYAWTGIDYKIMIGKPLLGYGPENFAVGFDKYYDPLVPNIAGEGNWWDKAHNIILQTGSEAGILGIIAYFALFVVLFWQLHKLKHAEKNADFNAGTTLTAHGIQATLIGYLVANFFSFDSFSTYLIFFLLIGYSMHLITQNNTQNEKQVNTERKNTLWKSGLVFILFCILLLFLWQYNILPLQINGEINKAGNLANQKKCDQAFSTMDKVLPKHTFLDSYIRMKYVESEKTCAEFYPEKNLTYIKKGLELMNEAVKIQPLYTRYWIYMGEYATILAGQKNNPDIKNNLIKQASDYFNKALRLSPKHQEIPIGQARMELIAGDYKNMQNYSEKCIVLNPGPGDCYWYLALSEIYLKDTGDADKNILIASGKGYSTNSVTSLNELSNAYVSIPDYQGLASVFEKLIAINPNIAQYHSILSFIYKELGQYEKATQEALKVLQLSPESKPNVDAFLKSLP